MPGPVGKLSHGEDTRGTPADTCYNLIDKFWLALGRGLWPVNASYMHKSLNHSQFDAMFFFNVGGGFFTLFPYKSRVLFHHSAVMTVGLSGRLHVGLLLNACHASSQEVVNEANTINWPGGHNDVGMCFSEYQ